MHDDWVPFHCLLCQTYRPHDAEKLLQCPDECYHSFTHRNTTGGEYVCPVCEMTWKAKPPEDWNGSILTDSKYA